MLGSLFDDGLARWLDCHGHVAALELAYDDGTRGFVLLRGVGASFTTEKAGRIVRIELGVECNGMFVPFPPR